MEIIELKLEELTPYENNARIHADKDISVIANSIKEFGMNDPIGIWGEKNIIVEGHGRLLALKKLGYKTAPCIRPQLTMTTSTLTVRRRKSRLSIVARFGNLASIIFAAVTQRTEVTWRN